MQAVILLMQKFQGIIADRVATSCLPSNGFLMA